MKKIEVAIVEDKSEMRNALRTLIDLSEGFECIHTYTNAEDALRSLPDIFPHVVLMDIELGKGMNGIECISKLKKISPDIQFLMLTVYEDDDKIFNALKAGASGYILKKSTPSQILDSIRELMDGGSPMSTQIARKVVDAFYKQNNEHQDISDEFYLTEQQQKILHLLAKGHMYKEISGELGISTETVRRHCHNIYDKLHVNSRTQAINKVFKKK